MCELLAISSLHPTRLTFSLESLASHSGLDSTTRDGWGAAFYQGNDVALFREPGSASDSPLVPFLQAQGPSTTLAISHIRRATLGEIKLANTQPFVRELAGRAHVFAHNGHLPGIAQAQPFRLGRFAPVGETDSEHAFCALMQRLGDIWHPPFAPPKLDDRLALIVAFAADLRKLGPANFLYSDGEVLFVHGHRRIQQPSGLIEAPGLFTLSRKCSNDREPVRARGLSIGCGYQEVTLVASVPLSNESWRPLAEGEILAVAGGKVIASNRP